MEDLWKLTSLRCNFSQYMVAERTLFKLKPGVVQFFGTDSQQVKLLETEIFWDDISLKKIY